MRVAGGFGPSPHRDNPNEVFVALEKVEPTATPVGTPEAIAEYGESPFVWGSCSEQRSIHPKIGGPLAGCPFWSECVFKKDRPRNIGVYVETETGANQQRVSSCFGYMASLHPRFKHMEQSGELIAIIADEGDMIEETVVLSEDPVACNKNGNMRLKTVVRQIEVPKFPQPGEEGSKLPPKGVDTRTFARRAIELRRQQFVDRKMGIAREQGMEDIPDVLDTEPTAAPAKRGPGRPPKRTIDPSEIGNG